MSQSLTPYGLSVKGTQPLRDDPARVLRECMAAHSVTIAQMADRWGVSATVAQRIVAGERPIAWHRLRSLPRAVALDFYSKCAASVEGKPTRSVEGEHLDVVVQLGRLTEELRVALADGRLDDAERSRIRDAAARLAAEVADVQRAVG